MFRLPEKFRMHTYVQFIVFYIGLLVTIAIIDKVFERSGHILSLYGSVSYLQPAAYPDSVSFPLNHLIQYNIIAHFSHAVLR